MKYRAIRAHSRRYPIRLMCRALTVSPAGYDAWAGRPESDRSVHNRTLLSVIRVIHRESRETTAAPASGRRSCSGGIGSASIASPD